MNFKEIFPDRRNEGKTKLKQAQLVMLRILDIVDYICKKNNIEYFLEAGTLLGAVRHKGFIPWDDDLDIGMLRKDYIKFIEIAKTELPDDLFLQTQETEKQSIYRWTKIRDNNSKIIEPHEVEGVKYNQGIFIDIFPFDLVDNIKKWTTKRENIFLSFSKIKKKYSNNKTRLIKAALAKLHIRIKNKEKIIKKLVEQLPQNDSKNVIYGIETPFFWTYKTEVIFPLKKITFEGKLYNAPNDTDSFLKIHYGNYMKIPEKEGQITHAVKIIPDFDKEGL